MKIAHSAPLTNHNPSTDKRRAQGTALADSALDQFEEAAFSYNSAVGSYNTHLHNHRDCCDLHDLPFRVPIAANDTYDPAMDGNRLAIEALVNALIAEAYLDSELRRHPGTFPIHLEACTHLQTSRTQLVTALEDALYHMRTTEG